MNTSNRNTITLNHDVFLRLKKEGVFGESYSDLVGRLLEEKRGKEERGKIGGRTIAEI
jgi:predicted CopG family antitoxin